MMRVRVSVVIKGSINSRELYERLRFCGANVTDLIDQTYVFAEVDLTEEESERLIKICNEYGECSVDLRLLPAA